MGSTGPSKTAARTARAGTGRAIAIRAITALIGGYAAASGLAALLARSLPGTRIEATGWAMILSFLFYAAIGLWCFHEPRLARVATFVWGIAALSIGGIMLLGVRP